MAEVTEGRTVEVRGRSVTVYPLKDAQLLMLGRDAELLGREGVSGRQKMEAAGFIMDAIESVFALDADRDYVMNLARRGTVDLKELIGYVTDAMELEEAPKKVAVRRGRPPRKSAQ